MTLGKTLILPVLCPQSLKWGNHYTSSWGVKDQCEELGQGWALNKSECFMDFLGGTVVKNPPADAGDTGSIPGPGRSHMPRSN